MNWQGKRVLVTGAGGFIGSHLAEELVHLGASVRAMVHYNALGRWGWLDDSALRNEIEVFTGDIGDRGSVEQAMRKVDITFHLAALIAIPYSYVAPYSYVKTNVEGTLNVLETARRLETERVVHTSTSEVYGTALYVPIDEKHPLQGQSPYSATKIAADKLAESYHCSFDLPVVTVRPFNTFGPRQSARAVLPTIIAQCLAGKNIKLGNLEARRDFNYVENTVAGFIKAAGCPEAVGKVLNVGSGHEVTIGEAASMIVELIGNDVEIQCDQQRLRPEKSEVDRLLADNQQAQQILDWHPEVDFAEGLKRTIEWFRHNLNRYRTDVYNV